MNQCKNLPLQYFVALMLHGKFLSLLQLNSLASRCSEALSNTSVT